VKRGFVVAVSGAAIVIAGLSGCSSSEKKSESTAESSASASATTSAAATASVSANAAPGGAKVSIDGQDQSINGTVACATMGENVNIAIGEATTGIGAVLSAGDTPTVHSVGLGNVNGVTLGFQEGVGQGTATAEKTGSTYKISGSATGVDMANPMQPINKPFEIEVTCP
jgi:lipoprotein LpqH